MKILLATLHAKYVHASLALPYLAAACADVDGVTTAIREFTVNEPPDRVLRAIVAEQAEVAAFSCYIWNIEATLRLAADLKKVAPATFIVLGGPEASFGCFELLERNPAVDCIVRGEGEETFRELATSFLCNDATTQPRNDATSLPRAAIPGLVYRAGDELVATPERPPLRELDRIPSPFAAGLADLAKPLVYYETSRGCPFSCAFCMSSLEQGVRSFSPERIEADLHLLMASGVKTVKLVDRTFNFDARRADAIWRFILRHNRESRFHFEIAADLLTEENLRLLEEVPPGLFRFEIGVQSGSEETLARVGRRSELPRLFANVRRLVARTGVTVHLDLVAGLPHENYPGFLDSLQLLFDALSTDNSYSFGCQGDEEEAPEAYRTVRREASDAVNAGRQTKTACHIQVEPLKVLKGSPMKKIAEEEGYAYSATPPYKILRTPWLSFAEICRIETVARLLDLFYNSGRCGATLALLAETAPLARLFDNLAQFWEHRGDDAGGSLSALFEALWDFGEEFTAGELRDRLRDALCYDYCRAEYPAAGKLPRFFPEYGTAQDMRREAEKPADIARRLGIAAGSRVRAFTRRFAGDPRQPTGKQRETELMFVYIATPGRGFEVRVLESGGETPPP